MKNSMNLADVVSPSYSAEFLTVKSYDMAQTALFLLRSRATDIYRFYKSIARGRV
jgi:hypothetical protein